MPQYGNVAVIAVNSMNPNNSNALQLWRQSLHINGVTDKSCPRIAFVGIYECGYINGRPAIRNIQNSISVIEQRAVAIRNLIMNQSPPSLPAIPKYQVWNQVGGPGSNDQSVIDVVYSLFNSNLLQ